MGATPIRSSEMVLGRFQISLAVPRLAVFLSFSIGRTLHHEALKYQPFLEMWGETIREECAVMADFLQNGGGWVCFIYCAGLDKRGIHRDK